ncbi:HAMP domain-containing histidine kinase [Streptosporangiaceae bacterium NEAU-GS5]|nr:HAMP domain-containing histidine kinase [Streptosporangiaceae bacterium NEAU-GS5]
MAKPSLRMWLLVALLGLSILPPSAVLAVHALGSGPDPAAAARSRAFATAGAARWTDPAWRAEALAYFAAERVDAELRPMSGPWLSSGAAPSHVDPSAKFVVRDLGSGWVIARPDAGGDDWTLALIAGGLTLALALAATGAFLGRHVVRPLAATGRAAEAIAGGEFGTDLPRGRVREVDAVATALRGMRDDLRGARAQRAELDEQRRAFIAAVAHDLRTPVFTLRAYLDGLDEGLADSPEKAARYIHVCRSSADALDRLVTDLFAYARTELLDQAPQCEPLDLAALLSAVALAHGPRADDKGITVTVTGSGTASADPHLLTRVAGNLLDNALRHTPPGGRIELECADAAFSVTDTGPGLPEDDLPHLFTPLYRGEDSRNRATGGAGLGLAIARRIVLAHGGTIDVGNAPPRGARFTVRLKAD